MSFGCGKFQPSVLEVQTSSLVVGMFEASNAFYTRPVLFFQRYAIVPINGDGEFTGDGSKGGDLCMGLIG